MAEINICMITDNNYVIPTAVAITSAISHKKIRLFTIFICWLTISAILTANNWRSWPGSRL